MVCDYCGGEGVPPIDEDGVQVLGDTSKPCPVCKTMLSNGLIELQALLYCSHCHGMLISMEKFLPLVDELRARRDRPAQYVAPRVDDSGRILQCPLCGRDMDDHPYGGGGNVNIDSCEGCAVVWLDGGELRRIIVAPDHGPLYLKHCDADQLDRQ
jgi:Zn-finger nucleic acid-binding protein